jgi:TM2 domain-containing membrane protein YozV
VLLSVCFILRGLDRFCALQALRAIAESEFMTGTTNESWIFVTTSPVDWTV